MTTTLYEVDKQDTTEDITLFVDESQMFDYDEPPIDWRWLLVTFFAIAMYPAYGVLCLARRVDHWLDMMDAAYMRFDAWMLDIISKAVYNFAPEIMRVSHG